MRTWTGIVSQIRSLKSLPCVFPKSIVPEIKSLWEKHNATVLDYLLNAIQISVIGEHEKEKRLRHYFAIRWNLIKNTSADYTFNALPSNRACALIARFIAKQEESIVNILMPSVKNIIGIVFTPTDHNIASYIPNEDFSFLDCLTASSGDALIALKELFSDIPQNTDRYFPVKNLPGDVNAYPLSADDREHMQCVAGGASQTFIALLQKKHRIRHCQKKSIGVALEKLQLALQAASRKKNGTETRSVIEQCEQPILEFYRLWRSLPDNAKDHINNYTSKDEKITLVRYLLQLFASVNLKEIVLNDKENTLVTAHHVFPCAEMIGDALEKILSAHTDLYLLAVPGYEKDFDNETAPTDDRITVVLRTLEAQLKSRGALMGRDSNCALRVHLFYLIVRHFSHEPSIPLRAFEAMPELTEKVTSLRNVVTILSLLPLQY